MIDAGDGDVLVRVRHVRAAGYCGAGMREICRLHGVSAEEMRSGIPVSRVMSWNDELATRVAMIAVEENGENEA